MPTPTQDQIAKVQTNLTAMKQFNTDVMNYSKNFVADAVNFLSGSNGNDPGYLVGLNILEGAFWAVGSNYGEVGNFTASFLSGMLSAWTSSPPQDLGHSATLLRERIRQTFLAVEDQIGYYYSNVASNWNTEFTFNNVTRTLADCANITFPVNGTDYDNMQNTASFTLKQKVWAYLLKSDFHITNWLPQAQYQQSKPSQTDPPNDWAQGFQNGHPAYYIVFSWQNITGCGGYTGWVYNEYSIGSSPGTWSDGAISNDAANHIFGTGGSDNALGLDGAIFTRKTLFTELGIPEQDHVSGSGMRAVAPVDPTPASPLSTAYLRAEAQGNTLPTLIEREGRAAVEARVLAEARTNSIFAAELQHQPILALENFLGVKIPEGITLHIVMEDSRNFGLVIPAAPSS